jgi:peptidoglycan/LPS O-acetylase OafA/YrhL
MPACVRRGLILLGVSYAPGIVDLIRGQLPPTPGLPTWFGPVVVIVTLFIGGLMAAFIFLGHNWARWLFAVLVLLGIPALAAASSQLATQFEQRPTRAVIMVVQTIMQVAAAIMFFLPPANEWFRAIKARARP